MVITSVEESKNSKDILLVYIDGSYSFSISREDYISLNLYEEKELTEEDVEYIKITVNVRAAKYAAVKYLSLKRRSSGEVYGKLRREGYDSDVIEKAIEELQDMGYINDRVYARKFVNDRIKLKPKSVRMLKMELQNKGIEDEIIDEVLREVDQDDEEIALRLISKKFGRYDLRDEKVQKKAYTFLCGRGFSYHLASKVINRIINEK